MYLVSLYTKDPIKGDVDASFNLAMFPDTDQGREAASRMARCYGYAYETGYKWAAVRICGKRDCLEVITVGSY